MTPQPNVASSRMQAYSKWTARIALIVLGMALLLGSAALPIHENPGSGAVWPLSRHFGHGHVIADIEVVIGWMVAVLAALILIGYCISGLLCRAGWAGKKSDA